MWFMVQSEQPPPQKLKNPTFSFCWWSFFVFCEERKRIIGIKKDLEKEAQWRVKFWSFQLV
jgi:hypothetical protein